MSGELKRFDLLTCLSAILLFQLVGLTTMTADEVVMKDGTVLKGTITEQTDEKLTITVMDGGEQVLQRSNISDFTLDRTQVTLKNSDTVTGRVIEQTDEHTILDIKNGGTVTLNRENIKSSEEVQIRYAGLPPGKEIPLTGPVHWSGSLDVGYSVKRGNSTEDDFYIRGRLLYERKPLTNETTAQFNYATSKDETTEDRADVQNQLNYTVNTSIFVYHDLTVGYDNVRSLDYFIDTSAGVGKEFLLDYPSQLKIRTGPSYRHEARANGTNEDELFVLIGESFKTQLNESMSLRQGLELYPSITDSGEYRQEAFVELKIDLTGNWALKLYGEQVYDSDPVPGTEKEDLRFVSTLGYSF
jgi:putative salt-induced outer membrane protein YdiY